MYFVFINAEYDGDTFVSFDEETPAHNYIESRLDDGVELERITLIEGRMRTLKPVVRVTRVEIL
jgi:hypothetical protein